MLISYSVQFPYHETIMVTEYDHPLVSTRPELFDPGTLTPVTLHSQFGPGPQVGTTSLRFLDLTQPEKRVIWCLRTQGVLLTQPPNFPYLEHLDQPRHNILTTWHLYLVNNLGFRGNWTEDDASCTDAPTIFSGSEPFANQSCGLNTNSQGERYIIPLSPYRVHILLEHGYRIQNLDGGTIRPLNLTLFGPEDTHHTQGNGAVLSPGHSTPPCKPRGYQPKTPHKKGKGQSKGHPGHWDAKTYRKRPISPNALDTKDTHRHRDRCYQSTS